MNTKHLWGGIALAGLLVAAMPALAFSKPKATVNDAIIDALISQGSQELDADNYKSAIETYQAAIKNPVFAATSQRNHYLVYYGLGIAEFGDGQRDEAYAAMDQARPFVDDNTDFWYTMAIVAHADKHYDAAAEALTKYAAAEPDHLNDMADDEISVIVGDARKIDDGGADRQALLEALLAAKYHPSNPLWTAEWVWSDLFEIYAQQGQDDKARALLPSLVSPDSVLDIRVDNRFARFVAADPARFDYAKAQDAAISEDQRLAAAHPDLIDGAQQLSVDLTQAGWLDEALKVDDDAIAKAKADPKAYSDLDDYLHWVHDQRGKILSRMGRWDEAAAAMDTASNLGGDDKVSHTINLADLYYAMGKPQAALDTVKDMDENTASPYGLMSADEARACAYAELGDLSKLADTLNYMTGHIKDGWAPLQSALLCTGDVDGLATRIIARLDDPDTRVETLVSLQDYMPLPHPSQMQSLMMGAWDRVRSRDDVKAAVAKYGVIVQVPTFSPTY